MFERLVLAGYPHTTLSTQHRMRPEIAALVRHLTYPELVDAPTTQGRASLRGVRDNVIFVNHDHPEDDITNILDRRDLRSKSTKSNKYEVEMVLNVVKYFGHQDYKTGQIVVLTPYLGQLQDLRTVFAQDNDPVLNDLDSNELFRAGFKPVTGAGIFGNTIKLATIGAIKINVNIHIKLTQTAMQTITKAKKAISSFAP